MSIDIDALIDVENSTQKKRIFWDPEIYELELERIFGRSWLFLTHECLIPKYGDFVTASMAEDPIVVVRQKDGSVAAFINTCSHRGNAVCHADSGNCRAFVCNYHGWVYDTAGELVEVPLEQRCYHGNLDKEKLTLPKIRVESYRGFLFGNFDTQAPSLEDYLGDMGWLLDTFMIGAGEGMELLGPPMKSRLSCNWKVPSENFVGDAYHVGWTHAGALRVLGGELSALAGLNENLPLDDLGLQFTTRYGHGCGVIHHAAPSLHVKRQRYDHFLKETAPRVKEKLGDVRGDLFDGHWNCTLFPNCSFLVGTQTFKVWHPRGPHEIEVWTWTLVHKSMDEETKREVQREAIRTFGTAGTFESDDGENMMECTYGNRGWRNRQGSMNSTMGEGYEGPHPDFPCIVGSSFVGETSYRGFYRYYAETLKARDWKAIRENDDRWDEIWRGNDFWQRQLAAD